MAEKRYGKAALRGAGFGAVVGVSFGILLIFLALLGLLGMPRVPEVVFGVSTFVIVGVIISFLSHALSRRRRDFSPVGGTQAGRYNVVADEEVAEEASRLLAGLR